MRKAAIAVVGAVVVSAAIFMATSSRDHGASPISKAKLSSYSATVGTLPPSERVQETMTMPGGDTIAPAPLSDSVNTSPQSAISAASATGIDGIDSTTVQPTVQYGLLSESEGGTVTPPGVSNSTSESSSSFAGPYQNTPVWVVTYPGISTPTDGPPPPPGGWVPSSSSTTTAPIPAGSGSLYIFVNDSTGQYLGGESY
jgi:hypothetical protein